VRSAGGHLRQLFGDGFKVPVGLEADAWPNHAEGEFREHQVLRQSGAKHHRQGIIGQRASV